jgi:RNA-directed DNA polymerase
MARRQKIQLELAFGTDARGEAPSAAPQGTETSTAASRPETPAASGPMMEAVVERDNLRKALAQVRRNKGAPGLDGMTVDDLAPYLRDHWPAIRTQLLDGTYRPQPVKRVEIPKDGGGTRALGIPTVLDRFVQQAVLQVLQPAWDPTFSDASYGFRPGRSAHQAVARAQAYIAEGHACVVDLDLEKFFDRVDQDLLMGLVAVGPCLPAGQDATPQAPRGPTVGDRRLLRLLRGFLSAGVLADGLVGPTDEGVPQGGPLSPLLSNLMLDVLDHELARRGHRFVRYADDCNIHVRSRRAGERVMASVAVDRAAVDRDHAPQASGERQQERGGPALTPQVPGLQLHPREGATQAAGRAAGPGPVQGAGPGADAAGTWHQPSADGRGSPGLPGRLARLLRLLPDPDGLAHA